MGVKIVRRIRRRAYALVKFGDIAGLLAEQ